MYIILANGATLSPINIIGAKKIVQNATRDTLSFIFQGDASLDELDRIFTATNCETITIVDGDNEYVHSGYTVRYELKRSSVEVAPATESTDTEYENRVTVAMAQRTYMESQIASLTDTVDMLVLESLL